MELFREEVLKNRNNRLYGNVVLSTPLSSWALVWLICAMVLTIAVFVFTGSFIQKETVNGWLKPDKGIVKIVSPQMSSVKDVHIIEGQDVGSGEKLVTLDLDRSLTNGEAAIRISLDALQSRIDEQDKLSDVTSKKFSQMKKSLQEKISFAQDEQRGLTKRLEILNSRIEASEAILDRYLRLQEGQAASFLEVERQKDSLLALQQSANLLDQQIIIKNAEVANYKTELDNIPVLLEESQIENSQISADLIGQKARLLMQSSIVLDAPISGRVAALNVSAGQSLGPHDLVVSLLPEGGQLEAELFVPTKAAGFIKTGQDVFIKYQAFPYQKYGFAKGKISLISKTIFEPRDVPASVRMTEPVYRVTVILDKQTVEVNGEYFPLQSGMTLTADIVKEKRRLKDIIFEPLRSNRSN